MDSTARFLFRVVQRQKIKRRIKQVIFRNKQNKVIFTCTYDLVGFDLIVKKAKKNARRSIDFAVIVGFCVIEKYKNTR